MTGNELTEMLFLLIEEFSLGSHRKNVKCSWLECALWFFDAIVSLNCSIKNAPIHVHLKQSQCLRVRFDKQRTHSEETVECS